MPMRPSIHIKHIARQTRRCFATTTKKDPFQILSLPRDASQAAIKKRYYELAKKLHPDSPTGNLEQFRQVAQAYEFLADPTRRAMYLQSGFGWDASGPVNAWHHPPGNRPASYTNAYWASQDDIRYKGGAWSSHDSPRYMNNGRFISLVAGLTVLVGALHFINLFASRSTLVEAADRHHLRTSQDLARARQEAQLFGNQKAVERMLDRRMKYWREDAAGTRPVKQDNPE